MSAAVPTQIGKYRVLRLLGSGGMGRVYLAEDPDIGRQVAIKRVTLGVDPQARERFIREAQTMGRLNHPNIVTLLEYGVDQDTPFLVLEYLSGEDLSQWMLRPQRLREQLGVMLGVAQALAAAHRMGVLHRDLKPENVRVLEDGRCKLLDFGIAQSGAGQLTASGYFVGTPEFVAPEVMSGASHSKSADIYALGLVCYVLLCGENPFRGDTVQATVARVIQRELPPLDKRLGGLPPGLVRLVHACLEKQPERRPASVDDVVAVLTDALAAVGPEAVARELPRAADTAAQPVPATRVTQTTLAAAGRAPGPARAWTLLALALALAGFSLWWVLQPPPASLPPPPAASAPTSPAAPRPAPTVPAPDPAATLPETQPATAPAATHAGPEPVPQAAASSATRQPPPAAADAGASGPVKPPQGPKPAPAESATVDAGPSPATEAPAPAVRQEAAAPVPAPPAEVAPPKAEPVHLAAAIRIERVQPRVLRAGRSAAVRIEGAGLAAVEGVSVTSGGAADARFRVSELRHDGDHALSFTLNVARGVPLGSYALLLQGAGQRHPPILLEVSL